MSDTPQTEVPNTKPEKQSVDWGNRSQMISAACAAISALSAVLVAAIAIYALFFSPTSQMVVAYLHSELTLRNSQIGNLQTKVDQVGSTLSQTELALVREKINQHISMTIISTLALRIIGELGSPQGIRPRKENVWDTNQLDRS
jgi:hypothetical protein